MNWKLIILLAAFLSGIFLAGAKDQSVLFAYSFANSTYTERTIDFSSLLFKVSTDRDAACRYDTEKGISYENMDGRFDLTSGKLHEKTFTDLGDGIYKYYVRCKDNISEGAELETAVMVNSLVTSHIVLGEDEPIRDGRYEITLVTSKIVSQAPSLTYSFDGVVYEPLPLTGSEKNWKGYLIIPKSFGEGVVSFKFKANDLEGREGSEIISGGAYLVDTAKPRTISSITATGYKGEIKLEWYLDESDIEEYKIYRSTSQNLGGTDFYMAIAESPFHDTAVDDGETYYYRVAGVDEAGNEADLSLEVYATALLSNRTSSSGLDSRLVGKVDNFLKELDLTASSVDSIKNSVSLKEGKEKELFEKLDLAKEIDGAVSELNALKKDAEKYKLQDLSEEELGNKMSSLEVKLSIIKKKVPESLVVLVEDSVEEKIESQEIGEAILEINPDVTGKVRDKSIKESLRIADSSGLKVESFFYVVEVVYMEGTKKKVSIVKREISSKLGEIEWSGEGDFIEIIPKEIAESASEIDIRNANHQVVKEDPILSFGADSKEIFYSLGKEISPASLKNIGFVFISMDETAESDITGYFIFESGLGNYAGIFAGAAVIAVLLVYLLYLRKSRGSEQFLQISHKIRESRGFLKRGETEKAREGYLFIKNSYSGLDKREKKRAYRKINKLHKKLGGKNGL
ncbi:hypothetical protein A3K73_05475 [Candidatus Pacearchaeota archaeon RBG_13_36_9]|nr:MAG: hypothetical protein A3K73_05475 [Candidatus Pacearchaeota archaeon RBG_13_36_9]